MRRGRSVPGNSAEDLGLLSAAIERFGSAAALARAYGGGIKTNTPNEWLRRIRAGGQLSTDKRRRIQELLSLPAQAEGGLEGADEIPAQYRRQYQRAVARLRTIFKSNVPRYRRGIIVNLEAISQAAEGRPPSAESTARAGPRRPRRVDPRERQRARRR